MEENTIYISEAKLKEEGQKGVDNFLQLFIDAYVQVSGQELEKESMGLLNGWQHTLLGYSILRRELMEGGFVQLIHNGYGAYIFDNPFAKVMRLMGLQEFSKLIYKAKKLYDLHAEAIVQECTEEEFMALYEQYTDFDEIEEKFMEMEEEITYTIAHYVEEHMADFASVTD